MTDEEKKQTEGGLAPGCCNPVTALDSHLRLAGNSPDGKFNCGG